VLLMGRSKPTLFQSLMPLNDYAEPTAPQPQEAVQPQTVKRAWWQPLVVITFAAVISVFVLRLGIANGFRGIAANRVNSGALSSGHRWLIRAEQLSTSPDGQLMLARIWRNIGARDRWDTLMSAVDASTEARLERRLGKIRWGEEQAITADELNRLVRQGANRDDAAASLVLGLLESGKPLGAEQVLQAWQGDAEHPAQRVWLSGVLQQHRQVYDLAREQFEMALEIQPDHDNARLGLAQVLEQLHQLDAAATQFTLYLESFPDSEPALLGLVRCARRLGQVDRAADLIEAAISAPNPSVPVWLEAAEVAYFSGDYVEAAQRFERADLAGPHLAVTIRTAATAYALAGTPVRAQELFNRYLAAHSLAYRRQILETRVREDPSDTVAAEELRTILAGEYEPLAAQPEPFGTISPLFSRHCAACHGEGGLGDGPANRHLYPPSRNLRDERYRLVTTVNQFPSPDDIGRVIRQGIPGTAMRAFEELTDAEVDRLVDDVYRLRQIGFRSRVIERYHRIGEDIAEEVLAELVQEQGTAGESVDFPDWPAADAEQLATGRLLFEQAACNRCHRDDGQENTLLLLDDQGNPTIARDLVHDPLKGGDDPNALYARLRLGMPGTPHPANPTLSDDQLTALVQYCRSLAHQPKRESTGYQRASRVQQQAIRAVGAASGLKAADLRDQQ